MARLKKEKILAHAEMLLNQDRLKEHGNFNDNHWRASILWSTILGVKISPREVALCLALMKISRSVANKDNMDNYIDAVAYIAGAGELSND